MKNIIHLSLIFLLLVFQAEAKKVEGTAIYENETLNLTFDIPMGLSKIHFYKLEYDIHYYGENDEKIPLATFKLQQVRFSINGKLFIMKPIPANGIIRFADHRRKFIRLETSNDEGKIQVYSYTVFENQLSWKPYVTVNNETKITRYILIKDGIITPVPLGKFKRFIRDYFKDCITLIAKVEMRQLGRQHLGKIADYYNSSCK